MAWCRLADSHNPNRSPEQCLQTQSYVIIGPRLKLVNFTTLLLAQTVNGTGRPGTQRSTGHCVSVSGRPAAQRPIGHCVAGHPGTQRSTAHCVAGTRVHSIVPPTMLHSEQKCAHFCSEWSLVGYGTSAIWDLWIRSIAGCQSQSEKWNRFGTLHRRGSTKNFPVTRKINRAGFSANNIAWKFIRKNITPAYIMVKWYITNISNLTNFDIFSFARFTHEYYMDLSK